MAVERVIKLFGTVDVDMLRYFTRCVDILVAGKAKRIKVLLHSDGGEALVGLAISEYMRLHQEKGVKFEVTALGDCSSAATIILVCGDVRRITKESWVMVHEDSGKVSGDVRLMEVEIRQKRRLEDQWNIIFYSKTKFIGIEHWEKLNKETTYLSAHECKCFRLVDEVI